MSLTVTVFVVSLLAASVALPVVLIMLLRRNVIDHPNYRSSHTSPTPKGAGLALLFGILAGMIVGGGLPVGAFFAMLGFSALGAVDDWRPRSARARLAGQLALALVVVALMVLRWPEGADLSLGLIAVAWVLFPVAVNAANFMDGINGMSALHGIVLGITYFVLLVGAGAYNWGLLGVSLVGVSVAFLPWNMRSRAVIFLGDSGSYLLGAAVALLAIACYVHGIGELIAIAPFTIYLVDVFSTLLRRAGKKASLTRAHRDHTYQRLVILGWSHKRTSLFVTALSAWCGLLAIGAQRAVLPLPLMIVLLALITVGYLLTPTLVGRSRPT